MSLDPGPSELFEQHYPRPSARSAPVKKDKAPLSPSVRRKLARARREQAKADDAALRHPRPDPRPHEP